MMLQKLTLLWMLQEKKERIGKKGKLVARKEKRKRNEEPPRSRS